MPERLRNSGWVHVAVAPGAGLAAQIAAAMEGADPASDLVLVHPDLEFPQADWLEQLRACAYSAPRVGIVGCRLALPGGKLLHAGTYVLPDTYWVQQIGNLEKNVRQFASVREVEGVILSGAYIRRELLGAIGSPSEELDPGYADADYCLKAREAGFQVLCCGAVTLLNRKPRRDAEDLDHRVRSLQRSRHAFRDRWHATLGQRYVHELSWHSILESPTGYAVSCRELLRALDRNRVRVIYRFAYGPGTPGPDNEPEEETDDHLFNVLRARPEPPEPEYAVSFTQGDIFSKLAGRYRVGYTMLEVDGFPKEWVRQASEMDEVWVPTEFNRRGFLESGLKTPLFVIPLGIDPNYFHPDISGYPNPIGDFVFLSSFEWGARKAPELLLKTFNETFAAREPVRLLCKITNRSPSIRIIDEIRRLELREAGGRISFILNRQFPYSELGSLYRSADCYVSAGRGEGWDLPLMEAMACGLPAIATDWGAHTEYAHEGICYLLRIRGTVPALPSNPYYRGFRWADPDPDHLRSLLRKVYKSRDEARTRGAAAAAEIAAKWTWDNAAMRIFARLEGE
jgi:glycosyltransferase involved in cell wall biosynthesis